ncbi:type II toxin-antitoxin system VapC family toxin [Spirosoma luteolum]
MIIDTHILLWYAKGDERLAPALRDHIEQSQTPCFVSKASLWEITIKAALGKLDLGMAFDQFFDELPRQGFQLLDIDLADLRMLHRLPFYHGDPFDRLIIAQAIARNVPIMSDDAKFGRYPIQLVGT